MHLKRQVKAGILLYALLMTAILSLVLGFYMHRLKAAYEIQREHTLSSQSYVLAELAKPLAKEKDGKIVFDKGEVSYSYQGDKLKMTVTSEGHRFYYQFLTKKTVLAHNVQDATKPSLKASSSD